MKINLLFFGQLKEITGKSSMEISDVFTTDELKLKLVAEFPELATKKYLIAINKIVSQGNSALSNGDIVALLPAFSGG